MPTHCVEEGDHGVRSPGQADQEVLVPFLDMPRTPPNRLDWETLHDWLTPSDQVFPSQVAVMRPLKYPPPT